MKITRKICLRLTGSIDLLDMTETAMKAGMHSDLLSIPTKVRCAAVCLIISIKRKELVLGNTIDRLVGQKRGSIFEQTYHSPIS